MINIDVHTEAGKQTLESLVPKLGRLNATFVYNDGRKQAHRLSRSQHGDLMVMGKGRKRYGHLLFDEWCIGSISKINIAEKSAKSDAQKWEEGWNKVVIRLKASGLWKNYLKDVETGLDIGYEKIKKANEIYWHPWAGTDEEKKEQIRKMKELDPRLVGVDKDGHEYSDTSIIWTMNYAPKIKKMYFGKYYTEDILRDIASAMKNRTEYQVSRTAGYDVSVHYKPSKDGEYDSMWYSEEYRNCGNGHYYIGLDATHALFCEDD